MNPPTQTAQRPARLEPSAHNGNGNGLGTSAIDLGIPAGPGTYVGTDIGFRERLDAALIRGLDVGVALALLILLLPLMVAAAIAVRVESRGPTFFRAERVGFRGRRLRMLKFRKMHRHASGMALTTDDDHRFTRVGVMLAKLKLDELPQLWHVLVGDMSLVGPRPEDPGFVALHASEYDTILDVRPGITGFSQLAFLEESRILDDDNPLDHYVERILPQKVGLDMEYARSRSFRLNLRILRWTGAAVVMRRQVAVHRDTGKMNLRRR